MADFNPAFANAGPKREPTGDEITNGFPCGPADRELFNWLMYATQSEIDAVITRSGLTGSNADLTQLAQAIRSQSLNYRAAGGTANALTVTLDPAPASNTEMAGMPLRVVPALTNTGAATLAVNGMAALPVKTMRGADIVLGDLPAGVPVSLVCTGTAWIIAGLAYSDVKQTLRQNLILYVRKDGNDNNSGLTNNAAGAFLTIQAAVQAAITRYDASGFTVTIQVGGGTYNEAVTLSQTGTTDIVLTGDPATPTNCTISAPGSSDAVTVTISSRLTIGGFRLIASGGSALVGFDGSSIRFDSVNFGGALNAHIYGAQNSFIVADGNYTISGAAALHALAISSSNISLDGRAITFSGGTQNYNAQFVRANSAKIFASGTTFVNSGVVVGPRYLAEVGGLLWTSGGGANFFPGTIAGIVASGGQYF